LKHDIITIGGSAGCLDPLTTIVRSLPRDFSGTILVVIHISPDYISVLDEVLARAGKLPASQPTDHELVRPGHIYVARPDHHLTLEDGRVRVQKGPRENRHRPAIDPLFRTAAREYGARVIAILLSGMMDDGSAGVLAVRSRGGIAIVQDPDEAKWDQMPRRALRYGGADFILSAEKIGPKVLTLIESKGDEAMSKKNKGKRMVGAGSANEDPEQNLEATNGDEGEGKPSVFACPECHGVLWELKENEMVRFRCRVGHSYGAESLSKELSHTAETALWAAMRALEEKAAMQKRVADSAATMETVAQRLREQSDADEANAKVIRDMIFHRDDRLEEADQFQDDEPPQQVAS
jgi:two-component system chemotaxis response regulator CheB